MLAWRVGWFGLLLAPLAHAAWFGGWPWVPPQVLAMLVTFLTIGARRDG
jgi:hypothetical protein